MDYFVDNKISSVLYTEDFLKDNTLYWQIKPNYMSQQTKDKLQYHKLERLGFCECTLDDKSYAHIYANTNFCTMLFKYQRDKYIVLIEEPDKENVHILAIIYPNLSARCIASSLEDFLVFAEYYPDWITHEHPAIDSLPSAHTENLLALTGKSDAAWREIMKQTKMLPFEIKFKKHTGNESNNLTF